MTDRQTRAPTTAELKARIAELEAANKRIIESSQIQTANYADLEQELSEALKENELKDQELNDYHKKNDGEKMETGKNMAADVLFGKKPDSATEPLVLLQKIF